MKQPDEVLWELVRQWLTKADLDLRTAEKLLELPEPIRESAAFHCQQAVEKYLKAFLVARQVEFPKTHSIGRLLDLVSTVAPKLAAALDDTDALTPFGIEIRYPGDLPEMLPGQERELLALATRAREAILSHLDRNPGGSD